CGSRAAQAGVTAPAGASGAGMAVREPGAAGDAPGSTVGAFSSGERAGWDVLTAGEELDVHVRGMTDGDASDAWAGGGSKGGGEVTRGSRTRRARGLRSSRRRAPAARYGRGGRGMTTPVRGEVNLTPEWSFRSFPWIRAPPTSPLCGLDCGDARWKILRTRSGPASAGPPLRHVFPACERVRNSRRGSIWPRRGGDEEAPCVDGRAGQGGEDRARPGWGEEKGWTGGSIACGRVR